VLGPDISQRVGVGRVCVRTIYSNTLYRSSGGGWWYRCYGYGVGRDGGGGDWFVHWDCLAGDGDGDQIEQAKVVNLGGGASLVLAWIGLGALQPRHRRSQTAQQSCLLGSKE